MSSIDVKHNEHSFLFLSVVDDLGSWNASTSHVGLMKSLCWLQAIYWVGPFIGGIVAAIVYRVVQFINVRADILKTYEENVDQLLPTITLEGVSSVW